MTTPFELKIRQFAVEKAMLSPPCRILLGLSGGADSMALLHILHRWPEVEVAAVHIHHGLRGAEADRDAAFVQTACQRLGVSLTVCREEVATFAEQHKISLEEAGRRVRYAVFERLLTQDGFNAVATAHNADDRAETVLMRLIRGSGVDGLASIPVRRGSIIRPLLCATRREIEEFCEQQHIDYVTDSTNADVAYSRNKVRHHILPALEQLNPAVKEALCRLADHATQDSYYLQALATDALTAATDGESYRVTDILRQPLPIRRRMMVQMISRWGCTTYEETHIMALERALNEGTGQVCLPGNMGLQVSQDRLYLLDNHLPKEKSVLINLAEGHTTMYWQGREHTLSVMDRESYTSFQNVHKMFFKYAIAYDTIQGGLTVRTRQEGDYIHPAGRRIGKSLKKLFIEWKVPIQQRDSLPLLCDDSGVLLVPGYTCDERVRPQDTTKLFLVWQPTLQKE